MNTGSGYLFLSACSPPLFMEELLQMMQRLIKENEELKERVAILEQILHSYLPTIERD
jgi:hypothetical protein